jgi:hypothetical protein
MPAEHRTQASAVVRWESNPHRRHDSACRPTRETASDQALDRARGQALMMARPGSFRVVREHLVSRGGRW